MKTFILIVNLFISCYILGAQTSVNFVVSKVPISSQYQVGIRGSQNPLSWDETILMQSEAENYSIRVDFPADLTAVEFKFVLISEDGIVIWEQTPNRVLNLIEGQVLNSKHQWEVEQLVDLSLIKPLSPDQLLEDYQLFETMVLEVHPGTYRYQTKAQVEATLFELKETFRNPLNHGQAFLAMSKVTASLQCDHTKVGFYNQGPLMNTILHRRKDKLPFAFKWIDEQMILTYNGSEQLNLIKGTEIVKINGISVSDIQQKMFDYMAADGGTDHSRIAKMELAAYRFEFYPFDSLFPLLYPQTKDSFEITYRLFGESEQQTTLVQAQTRENRADILEERYPDFPKSCDDLWSIQILDDKTALLQLNSFALYGQFGLKLDYKAYLAKAFQQINTEKIQNLIIDIRGNNGGMDEIKDELFTYLPTKEKVSFERIGKTRYREFPENLKAHVKTWGDNPWYFNLKPDRKEGMYYLFKEAKNQNSIQPKKNQFQGNLFLLTSPVNASLAYYTAADFQQKRMGVILGEETGGNQRDINGGQILFLILPNSGIEVDFPVMGGFTLKDSPNRGIVPDYEVKLTQEAIANGKDPVLEKVKTLIQKP